MITQAEAADWLWQNPRPVGGPCVTGFAKYGEISFLDSQTGMAVGCSGKILRTDDGGLTWTDVAGDLDGTLISFFGVSVIDADTATAVGASTVGPGIAFEDLIVRTEDGGTTWTKQETGLQKNAAVRDVVFFGPDTGIAVGDTTIAAEELGSPVIIRTTDGGETWTATSVITAAPPWIFLGGLTCMDPLKCVAVGYGSEENFTEWGALVLQTTDGGDTWDTKLYDPETQAALQDVACSDTGTCVAVGRQGVIFASTDGGGNWTQQISRTAAILSSVSCVDGSTCLAASFGSPTSGILRTEDGGATWVQELEVPTSAFIGIAFHGDTGNATAMTWYSQPAYQSTDGGVTWSRHPQFQDAFRQIGFLRAVAFGTPTTGVAVGETNRPFERFHRMGELLWTADGGNTWTSRSLSLPIYPAPIFSDVAFADADTAFAVGKFPQANRGGVILRSDDGGASWSDLTAAIPSEFHDYELSAVHFVDEDVGTVVGGEQGSGVILHTLDGGSTWTNWTPPGPSGFFTGVFLSNPSTGTVVGHDGRILRTTDAAATWEAQVSGTDADLRGVDFSDESTGWVVGENTVLHTVDGGATWTDATPQVLLEAAEAFDLSDVAFSDADHGMMVGSLQPIGVVNSALTYGVVLSTQDGGATWELEEGKTSRVTEQLGVAPLGDGDWIAVGNVGGAYHSGSILRKSAEPTFQPLAAYPYAKAVCLPEGAPEEISVHAYVGAVGGYGETVQLSSSGEPAGVTSVLVPGTVDPPGRSTWTFTVDGSVSLGRHVITLSGDDGEQQHDANFTLNVVGSQQVPQLLQPADGATDVELFTTLAWSAIPGVESYRIQVAKDANFEDIVFDDTIVELAYETFGGLESLTQYFWRVQGIHLDCLEGVWSDVFSFTTKAAPEVDVNPLSLAFEVSLGEEDDAELEIANLGNGDLVWSLDVDLLPADGCAEAPWLSVSPDGGTTPANGSTRVIVTVETTGLEVCEYAASLHLASNDPTQGSVEVPVSLTVTGSDLEFDPQAVDFGEVEAGHNSPPVVVALRSVGVLDATGVEFQLQGDGFTVDTSGCGATLPAGGECELIVSFAPPGVGPLSAVLEAHSDDGAFASVALSGQGMPETEVFVPLGLDVDTEPIISDANGVFEPGELAQVAPTWRNEGISAQFLEGTASNLTGPAGPNYSLSAAEADYGEAEIGEAVSCEATELCYEMDIGPAGVPRPALHWDASFDEALSDESTHTWDLHLGDSFADVPRTSPFYTAVETLLHSGVTGGCAEAEYCPAAANARSQMAVFLIRAVEGSDYAPQACEQGEETFSDVPFDSPFCPWIEDLVARQVTSGCGGGRYCPADSVTRAQMAVFLLRALEGGDYTPPPCTGEFSDVSCSSQFAAWIEELAAREITGGCSVDPPAYCPAHPVTRAQMAAFVTKTFGLALYGP